MNDKPPERSRRSGFTLRRFTTALSTLLAVTVAGLWFAADQATAYRLSAQEPVPAGPAFVIVSAFLALIVLNAALVASEAALSVVKSVHVRHVAETSPLKGERLQALQGKAPEFVAACWLGSQICRLGLLFLCLFVAPGVNAWLSATTSWKPSFVSHLAVGAILLVPVSLINLIVEVVSKSYAKQHPHRATLSNYWLIRGCKALFSPLVMLVTAIANLFTARFGVKASLALSNQTEEEIKTLVESAQQTGEIESEEKELLHSVFEFSDTVAREVMTPRVDLDAVPVTTEAQAVMELIQKSGHSRIPVYEETDDQIIGVVHAKDLLMAMLKGKGRPNLRTLMRPAYFVPENKDLHELLREMRANRTQLVVVQDEFGGTAGIVTIEDIVEELVGDIVDEYDLEEPEVQPDDNGWIVDGKTHLDDLNDIIGSRLESDEFDTIGGYVFGLFGRQPKVGETIESNGFRFTVAESDGRRIVKLRIEPEVPLPAAEHTEEPTGL